MVQKTENACLDRVLLWGAKSKARLALEMIHESGVGTVDLIYDSTLDAVSFETSAQFINDISTLKLKLSLVSHFVVCIGGEHGFARCKAASALEQVGLRPLSLIHEKAFLEPTSEIGKGCQIMPFALVHKFSKLGDQTIVNTNATIDHECKLGNGVHVMGSAAIAGRVTIGDFATIGTNATVLPNLNIGEGAFVGAGAVVTTDVAPYSVVTGVPARHIKYHKPTYSAELLEQLTSV